MGVLKGPMIGRADAKVEAAPTKQAPVLPSTQFPIVAKAPIVRLTPAVNAATGTSAGTKILTVAVTEALEKVERRDRFQTNAQRLSLYVTIPSFVYTMFFFYPESGWWSIWGAIALLSGIWGLVYLYKCKNQGISPLEGKIVKNKFYNFILTEVAFSYFYVFTWVQLGTIVLYFRW